MRQFDSPALSSSKGTWLAATCLLLFASAVSAQPCTTVQLCIALDGSGSISPSNFDLMKTGLADAVRDASIVPRDGSVQLSITQFGPTRTEIAPTVINSDAVATNFANQLQAISKADGSTPIDQAINQCASLLNKSCPGRQVINIVTDGEPDSAPAAVTARQNAVNAGVDEVNAEALAAPANAFTFLKDQLVWPQPGYEAPPFSGGGFVIKTDTFEDFAEAVRGKIGSIVGPTTGCTIDPPSATNPVGTQHTFTVTVKADGQPQANIPVTVTIVSGPNAGGGSANANTRADGTIEAMYTSNGTPGTDVIQVTGMLDAPFSCTATKTWAPPTCSINPASASNPVGEQHLVTVTVHNADGTVATGVDVTVEIIAGPNSPASGTFETDSSGQVEAFYSGNGGQGTDTIEARGFVGSAAFSCTATKTWTPPVPRCSITPQSDTGLVNTQHQFIVTVTYGGTPQPGVGVTVNILSGPNAPDSGVATTDGNGQIDVTYPGDGGPGTDTIQASGSLAGIGFSCMATKTWVLPPPVCTINPQSDSNPIGTRHDMIVTVTRGGVPQSGVGVTVNITAGPNAPDGGTFVSGQNGQVSVFYVSNGLPGTDSITASGSVGGILFSCNATKTWVAPTSTPTRSFTRTSTPTRTPTPPRTSTPTRTASRTATGAPTATPSRTATVAHTPTNVPTSTPSRTPTVVHTPTDVPTSTPSRTATLTRTTTPTATTSPTDTRPPKPTFTPTLTFTPSQTFTSTPTEPPPPTVPPDSTATRTETPTRSATPSASPTNTVPGVPTSTHTASATSTHSATPTNTAQGGATATPTNTAQGGATATPTNTAQGGATATPTNTAQGGATATPTNTAQGGATPTHSATAAGSATPSVTPTPSATITTTPKGSFTVTETPTQGPTETATELGAATATPSLSPTADTGPCTCVGDCSCDGQVTIDEIVTMVNIAVDLADIEACLAGDPSGDSNVTVDELLQAITNALQGCRER